MKACRFLLRLITSLHYFGAALSQNGKSAYSKRDAGESIKIDSHSFLTIDTVSMFNCANYCLDNKQCVSWIFHRKEGKCQLNNETESNIPAGSIPQEGFWYFELQKENGETANRIWKMTTILNELSTESITEKITIETLTPSAVHPFLSLGTITGTITVPTITRLTTSKLSVKLDVTGSSTNTDTNTQSTEGVSTAASNTASSSEVMSHVVTTRGGTLGTQYSTANPVTTSTDADTTTATTDVTTDADFSKSRPTTMEPTAETTHRDTTTSRRTTVKPTTYMTTVGNTPIDQPTSSRPTTVETTHRETTTIHPTTVKPTTYMTTAEDTTTNKPTPSRPTTVETTNGETTTIHPTTVKPTTYMTTAGDTTTNQPTASRPTAVETTREYTTTQATTVKLTTYITTVGDTTCQPTSARPTIVVTTNEVTTTLQPTTSQPTTVKPTTYMTTAGDTITSQSTSSRLTTVATTWEDYTTLQPTTLGPTTAVTATAEDTKSEATTSWMTTGSQTTQVTGCSAFANEFGRVISYSSTQSGGRYSDLTEANFHFTCEDDQELIGESVARCHVNEWSGEGHCAENVALHKSASQSSSAFETKGFASNAVDGGTSGRWIDGSCTHTVYGETNPWLTVDLAGTFKIGLIRVYNRLDADLYKRLLGADVIVKNGNNETVVATMGEEVSTNPTDKPVDMVIGTHVTVYSGGDNKVVTVCELEVYGIPV